jgi:carbamoyltransferase
MKVLGLGTGGDSGAALVEDGELVAAVNEERLSRMKLVVGFPRASIREVLRLSGTDASELDGVLVGATAEMFVDALEPFDGWFRSGSNGKKAPVLKRAASKLSRYRDRLPFLEAGYYAMLAPAFHRRRVRTKRILETEFGIRCPVRFVDHHFCHITSAYFTSGFRDALVVSLDGGGDGLSSRVYAVRNGRFESIHATSAYNSLGNYYAYITHIAGFKAQKHEGKITGLAAHGEPVYADLLRGFIDEEDGRLINRGRVYYLEAIRELEKRLPSGWTREDLAASIQVHSEELVRRYVGYWARRTGLRDVAVAGGVFANVRINQEVHRLPEVDRIHVHPHMSDGGLPGGAALAACVPGTLPRTMSHPGTPLKDVYMGPGLTDADIGTALRKAGLAPEALECPLEERIADLLAAGHVVARAVGAMEYGPRALGHRSILYQPTDPAVNNWLNQNLRRTEFMPFAPSARVEAADRCFEGVSGAEHAAEFMTITFHCTPWMRRAMRGVVHLDGTARPHLVRRDREPSLYRVIDAFERRTGLPAVINTSFNMHEEPIVCSAEDCVRAFLDGNLDYLAIGDQLVAHPEGVRHPLEPAICA